jgi:hypothetical protein
LPAPSDDDDEPKAECVIEPKDFINSDDKEACTMNKALCGSQEAAAMMEQQEVVEWHATRRAVIEFEARDATVWPSAALKCRRGRPPPTALKCRRSGRSP